jgi:predicted dehydrogenase
MEQRYTTGVFKCGTTEPVAQLQHIIRFSTPQAVRVCAINKASGLQNATPLPGVEFVEDKEAILSDDSIDLVVVCNPDQKDLPLIAECIRAQKKVQILHD